MNQDALPSRGASAQFCTTHWSVVLTAGRSELPQAADALETLCRTYWFPLYVYVRRQGTSPEDAEDLTQEFFSRLIEKNYLTKADCERGRFRTFLLGSMKNFMINEWKRAGRLKRGNGIEFLSLDAETAEKRYVIEPSNETNPEAAYDRRWAVTLIEQALALLRREFDTADKAQLFAELKGFIWGDQSTASHAEIAGRLNLNEGTVKVAVHRLRLRFRELLRTEIAHTVAQPADIDAELRYLISAAS